MYIVSLDKLLKYEDKWWGVAERETGIFKKIYHMKKFLLCALLILSLSSAFAQTSVSWGSPVTVAMGSMYSNVYPRVSLVTGDAPIVVWGKNSPNVVYASRWNGSAFNVPVILNPSGISPFVADWAGAEVASAGDTVFATFSADPVGVNGHVFTVRSIDGGLTFDDTVRVTSIGGDVPRFPAIAVAPGGNPIVNFMRLDGSFGNAEYHVSRSMNGGMSYMPDVNASGLVAGNVCDCCPGTIVTSGDNHAVLYRNANSNIRTIHAEFSSNASATFPAAQEIDLTNWMISACPSSGPSGVIVGDTLIYTWMSKGSGQTRVYIGTVNINDQQIGIHKQIFVTSMGNHNFPVIAAKDDTVGVVWEGNVMGDVDIYFSYSTTGAAGIGLVVDTLTTAMTNDQSRPDIVFNNGIFHIVYSDNNGNDVKYLKGTISDISGIKTNENDAFKIISARGSNGKVEITIESPANIQSTIQVVNLSGQQNLNQELNISAGTHSYTVAGNYPIGMLYVNLITSEGKKYGAKLIMRR